MSTIHQQNQSLGRSFKTIDLLWVFLLVGVVGTISGAILAEALQDESPRHARQSAEVIAGQIRLMRLAENQANPSQSVSSHADLGGRSPASVATPSSDTEIATSGVMGHDPWGRPFRYLVVRMGQSGAGLRARIIVWSDGPNGRTESDPETIVERGVSGQSVFHGDDIGYVEEYSLD